MEVFGVVVDELFEFVCYGLWIVFEWWVDCVVVEGDVVDQDV